MLEEDLQVNDECLDGSGHCFKDKDEAVQKLGDARGVTRALQTTKKRREHFKCSRQQWMVAIEGILQLVNLSNDTMLQDLRQRLRSSLNELTTQTM